MWGAPSHILQKTKNNNKKTYKKTDAPPWAGISSMQSPTQPLGCIVGSLHKLDKAKKLPKMEKKEKKMTRKEWIENFTRKLMREEDLEYSEAKEIAELEYIETGREDPEEDGDDE